MDKCTFDVLQRVSGHVGISVEELCSELSLPLPELHGSAHGSPKQPTNEVADVAAHLSVSIEVISQLPLHPQHPHQWQQLPLQQELQTPLPQAQHTELPALQQAWQSDQAAANASAADQSVPGHALSR